MATRTHSFTTRQKMSKNTFEVFHFRDASMQEVALHHHDFYEIYFFVSGSVSYNIESRSYRLSPGDILLISPHELHQPIFSPENQSYERIVLWLNVGFLQQFSLEGRDMTQCFNSPASERSNLIRPDGVTRELMNYLFQQLLHEQDSEEFGSALCCMSLLGQLLVMINRAALRAAQGPENRENTDSTVYRILTYINEHYNEELNLDFLANKFFISKFHLSREFNRVVGTSVHRYILQKRLIMARQMMATGIPTSEVYQHCGFGDYSNFYRAFRKEYQMSPREYMEELKRDATGSRELAKLKELVEQ